MEKQVEPYYRWQFHTSHGKRIGSISGPLKLMFKIPIVYGNFPGTVTEHFTINQLGFRGAPPADPKLPYKKRIVVLGGSSAFGTGLRSDDETFQSYMEKSDPHLEVINAGVIGHKSGNELAYLVTEIVDLSPDLIIAFDGWNDVNSPYKDLPLVAEDFEGANQIENKLEMREALYDPNLFKRIFLSAPKIIFPHVILLKQNFVRPQKEIYLPTERTVSRYVRNMEKMNHIAAAFGSRFLCVLQPQKPASNPTEAQKRYSDFCLRVKGLLKEKSIPFLDLNDHSDQFAESMFMDQIHLNKKGQLVVANLVMSQLERMDLTDAA